VILVSSLLCFLLTPILVFADAGIPMIMLTLPSMIALLLPIVLLEAFLYTKFLKVTFSKTIGPAFTSNLLSTLVGIPLAWIMQGILGYVIFLCIGWAGYYPDFSSEYSLMHNILKIIITAPWIWPSSAGNGSVLIWAVPFAAFITLLPAYFVSVWLESMVVRRYFRDRDPVEVKRAVRNVNIVSYALLALFCIGLLIYCIATSTRLV